MTMAGENRHENEMHQVSVFILADTLHGYVIFHVIATSDEIDSFLDAITKRRRYFYSC